MSETVTTFQKSRIAILAIIWFALALFAFVGFAVVGELPWWMIALVVLAGIVAGLPLFLLRWLFKRRNPTWSARVSFVAFAVAGVLAATGLAGLPVYYMAYWVDAGPTSVPLATLSNGKKTVVFQGMQHVGSEGFYKSVVFDLEKALTDGYTLFYEGVQSVPGRPDLDEWFNKTLRGSNTDLNASYQQLAKACSLTFQLTYFQPLLADKATNPSRHVTADVSYLDMKTEYDRLMREDPAFAAALRAEAAKPAKAKGSDPLMSAIGGVGSATSAQRKLVGIMCRGVIAMAIGGTPPEETNPMERVILDYRNRALARFVAESPASKIYITYGAKHFPGFIAELRKIDPAFEVRSLTWGRAMSNPRDSVPPPGDWQSIVRR